MNKIQEDFREKVSVGELRELMAAAKAAGWVDLDHHCMNWKNKVSEEGTESVSEYPGPTTTFEHMNAHADARATPSKFSGGGAAASATSAVLEHLTGATERGMGTGAANCTVIAPPGESAAERRLREIRSAPPAAADDQQAIDEALRELEKLDQERTGGTVSVVNETSGHDNCYSYRNESTWSR